MKIVKIRGKVQIANKIRLFKLPIKVKIKIIGKIKIMLGSDNQVRVRKNSMTNPVLFTRRSTKPSMPSFKVRTPIRSAGIHINPNNHHPSGSW